MAVRWVPVLVALAGCGRIAFRDAPADARVDAIVDAPDANEPIVPCADSYTATASGSQSRYRLALANTWLNAEHACEADGRGMHLVVIDPVERNGVEGIAMGMVIWVGLSDRVTDGTVLAVTGGPPEDAPWDSGGPTLAGPGCVEFNPSSRTIRDVACDTLVPYICECDEIPAQPSSY
jgi:hypothetical protein